MLLLFILYNFLGFIRTGRAEVKQRTDINQNSIWMNLLGFLRRIVVSEMVEITASLAELLKRFAGVAQLVEQLICNQQVGGSSPFAGSIRKNIGKKKFRTSMEEKKKINITGEMPEWSKGADCKSAGVRLRRFKSSSPHNYASVVQW